MAGGPHVRDVQSSKRLLQFQWKDQGAWIEWERRFGHAKTKENATVFESNNNNSVWQT